MATKEDLLKEIGKLKSKVDDYKEDDRETRKEFAKAFNWYESKTYMYSGTETKLKEPTWYEIFQEIGRLQEKKRLFNEDERMHYLEQVLENLENKINQ